MHREDGQMQLTHICGPMPSELPMIAETTHQPTEMTLVQCQNSVQQVECQQYRISITLDAQHMF